MMSWIPILTVIFSCIFAGIAWTVWVVKNVPQTSYIEELFIKEQKYIDTKVLESIKYTDDKIFTLRREAFDHSDINKGIMETEYKGLSAKIDMLILMVQQQSSNKK